MSDTSHSSDETLPIEGHYPLKTQPAPSHPLVGVECDFGETVCSQPGLSTGLDQETQGRQLGRYRLLEPLGEGGFGTVWKAWQAEPVRRHVAVKIIKPGMDSREVLSRFALERQALAMMDHTGIAAVYDAGVTDAGRPYFVMELVNGSAVTAYCDSRQLDTAGRLRLLLDICAAVQHAHQKGIIHRDLKPSNILVAESDGQPLPKIIDFGVARAVGPDTTDITVQTSPGRFIGTPAYMSPEQASSDGADIDTRSDVYSLGVLLYQLLTGTTPFETRTAGASLDEMRRIIRDEAPPTPSTAIGRLKGEALTAVTTARKTALRDLSLLLRRDLDWVVIKALEKDRDRRYESATALAADIRRYLDGEPVKARPPGIAYRTGKVIRKYKRQSAAAAAVLVALTGGLAASTTMFLREKAAADREEAERKNVENETTRVRTESAKLSQTAQILNDLLAGVNPDVAKGANQSQMKRILAAAAARVGSDLAGQPEVEAFLRNTIGGTYFAMGLDKDAKSQFDAGLKSATASLGLENRLTLKFRSNLANLMSSPRDLPLAESEYRAIEKIQADAFGPKDRETLTTRSNLANVLGKLGRLPDAESEYSDVYELQREVLSPEHPDTLTTRAALANTRRELGMDVVAEYRETVAAMADSPLFGSDHPDTLAARYGLADALAAVKKLPAARAEHEAVWELRKKVLSETHKKTLRSRYRIGAILHAENKFPEAATHYREVLRHQEALVKRGRLDPIEPLETRNALAAAAGAMGEHAEAATQFKAVIAEMESLGAKPDSRAVLSARYNLALALFHQGAYPEAEIEQRKVVAGRNAKFPPGHPDTLRAIESLLDILQKQGKTAEAQELQRELAGRK